jgi:threonine/homoserine/homoserine lactone efflux protein
VGGSQKPEAGVVELVWSFAPWLVFLLVGRFATLEDAVACAVAAAIIVMGRALLHQHVHLLDVASIVYFVGLLIVVLAADTSAQGDISNYAQAGAHIALTIIVAGSILIGHPFTESYARESVPREFWDTPRFHEINRHISAAWALAFLVGSISLLIAANTDDYPVLLRILVPFGALYWAYTVTEKVRNAPAPSDAGSSSG